MPLPEFMSYWGKARPVSNDGPRWHPIAYHLLDVASVAEAILAARPLSARRLARLLDLAESDARQLAVTLAGLHDLGKFAPAFQAKASVHWPTAALGPYSDSYAVRRPHTADGFALWDEHLADRLADHIWVGGADALYALAPLSANMSETPILPEFSVRG